ncbi:MAG: RHS repeat-associated core domain-containing protein, partial [Candidatus Kapaibacterium sp.]
MGARLYNSETGRFMSVDPLMEIFTGHSPYHYSYNNPVMFSDPSGLAPEGEKNNSVQAPGADAISGGISIGYWVESTQKVWNGKMSIVNPLDPTTHRIMEDGFVWEWVEPGVAAGGGGGGASPKYSPSEVYGSTSQIRSNSSRILPNQNSLRIKSVTGQTAVNSNTKINLEPQQKMLNRLVADIQYDFNAPQHQLSQDYSMNRNYVQPLDVQVYNYLEKTIPLIIEGVNDATSASGGVVFIIENSPQLTNSFNMVLSRLGLNLTGAGVAINGFMSFSSIVNGDVVMAASFATDGLMGVVATTSLPGFAIATIYFGVQYFYPGQHDSGWVNLNRDLSRLFIIRNTKIVNSLLNGTYSRKLNGFK